MRQGRLTMKDLERKSLEELETAYLKLKIESRETKFVYRTQALLFMTFSLALLILSNFPIWADLIWIVIAWIDTLYNVWKRWTKKS